MKRAGAGRRIAISAGRELMSSRWISMSLSGAARPGAAARAAWTDLTSEDFPMPRAPPQQHIVGGQSGGETAGVVDQNVADMIDTLDQRDLDPVRPGHRRQMLIIRIPDKTGRRIEIVRCRHRRRQRFHGARQAGEFDEDLAGGFILHGNVQDVVDVAMWRPAWRSSGRTRGWPTVIQNGCISVWFGLNHPGGTCTQAGSTA